MELHQLRYFVAVAETGGFSKAARVCFVAQPSLSQQIKKLEQELGQMLFERLGRTTVLTEAGRALLPRARVILKEAGDIKAGIKEDVSSGAGHLSVGLIPTIAPYILPGALKRFYESFPRAQIGVEENLTERLVKKIIGLEIEMAVMSLPIDDRLIITESLFEDPLVLALSPGHELAKSDDVSIEDLKSVPFIALDEEHCLGEQINNFCYERQINPEIVCRTWNLSTIQHCVSFGSGVSLVPKMLVMTDVSNKCVYRSIEGQSPKRTVVAAWHRDRKISKLAGEFIRIVKDEYEYLVSNGARDV
ncbi:MAG TPA: LysR family transcriptional regulator [Thermodesulfobacteriota bacterium]|nr:LysR family transcriptional regulator [Thermodesulfobacteriota bacterium]